MSDSSRKKILIVDDERGVRDSLRLLLKSSFDVHTAEDGTHSKTYPVTALNDVTLYAKNDLKSETTTLKTGEKLTITATDNAQWVLAENAAGAECWLHLSEGGQSVDTPAGAVYASQAFDGLVFAD